MVKIVLKTADWDDTAQTHNALATESAFIDCDIQHEFNRPAKATITLADPTGSIMQKYDVDPANDSVYVGPGRAYLYDDDDVGDASIFDGRIIRATCDAQHNTVTLECADWLSQLDEERIDYDMRESLNVSNLRQSTVHTDADNGTFVGPAYMTYAALAGAVAIDGVAETDDTTDANDAGANDMELLPAVPVTGDAYCFGMAVKARGVRVNVGTAGSNGAGGGDVYTITWRYSQGSDTWADLVGVTDGTNGFHNAGSNNITFTIPDDWATDEVGGITAYWVRAVVTVSGANIYPIGTQAWVITSSVFDDAMTWAVDTYNGKYLVLAGGMAGSITVGSGPYQGTATGADAYSDDPHVTWVDDNTVDLVSDNDSNYTLDYAFRIYVGNDTPSDFYVHSSISAARIILTYLVTGNCTCKLQIDDKTDGWIDLDDLDIGFGTSKRLTVNIPTEHLSKIIDANGIAIIRFAVTWGSGNASVGVKYIRLEVDVDTTGYSDAAYIIDTASNYLQIQTDMSPGNPAVCIWEGIPYAVAKHIYKHIDTVEGGTLVSDGDVIYAMTAAANIEHTTGISTRHYIGRTRLEIIQDIASQDKSVFYVPLGTVALTWKSTFNNGAPTALTDASVLNLQGDWNYNSMFNKYTVSGARIGDYQIESTDYDTTSKATYGIYRSRVIKNTGVLSDYDCAQMADKLVTRDKDVQLYLEAELGGLSSLRLGDELDISSTTFGLTNENYTVTHWQFRLKEYRTRLRLQPRASTSGYQENVSFTQIRSTIESQKTTQQDRHVPDLYTQEWA